jgi:hypothetical protein
MDSAAGIRALLLALSIAAGGSSLWADPGFTMADTLVCTIEASSSPAETGKKITLNGLTSATPQALYENHVRASLLRLFESDKTLVLQLVAAISGSVDTLVIDKTSGRFAHTAAGAFLEVHAIAETGTCRPE